MMSRRATPCECDMLDLVEDRGNWENLILSVIAHFFIQRAAFCPESNHVLLISRGGHHDQVRCSAH